MACTWPGASFVEKPDEPGRFRYVPLSKMVKLMHQPRDAQETHTGAGRNGTNSGGAVGGGGTEGNGTSNAEARGSTGRPDETNGMNGTREV